MEDRQKIIAKLVKIKALAERGIGGEQQTAQVMYTTLKEKYKVTDAEIEKAAEVPVDISEIDLKKFWGIAFQLATVAKDITGGNRHLHCLPVHIHGRTMHGLWYILEHAGLTAGF